MIEINNNHDESIRLLKIEKPYFNEENFKEIQKLKFSIFYRSLKTSHIAFIYSMCTENFINELKNNKEKIIMLDDDIDFVNVQNVVVKNFRQKETIIELDADFFLYYIDYMYNNKVDSNPQKKRYFDIAYRITFCIPINDSRMNETICPMCGGHLTYNKARHYFICDYCKYENFFEYNNWKFDKIIRI